MQTLNVEITNKSALKILEELQAKDLIKIRTIPDFNSPLFPGEPLTTEEFKNMVTASEASGSLSLNEAKIKWKNQRKQLSTLGN